MKRRDLDWTKTPKQPIIDCIDLVVKVFTSREVSASDGPFLTRFLGYLCKIDDWQNKKCRKTEIKKTIREGRELLEKQLRAEDLEELRGPNEKEGE